MFPGNEDLNTFVTEAKSPTLQAFASNRVKQIAQWTIDQTVNTDTEIFNLWPRRFIKSLTINRPEIQIKKQTTSVNGLLEFKNTLRLLFAFKDFTLRVGRIAEHSLEERRKVDRFREVIDIAATTLSPTLHHDIFFTPTTHRVKRTKTEDNV